MEAKDVSEISSVKMLQVKDSVSLPQRLMGSPTSANEDIFIKEFINEGNKL